MNAEELIETLKTTIDEQYGSLNDFLEIVEVNDLSVEGCEEPYAAIDRKALAALGPFEQVMHKRTGSDASVMRYVYHFLAHDIYLCLDGQYSSWDATQFREPWYEVKPETVTTVRYKRVK